MDKAYPPEAWRRLGKALVTRRNRLGYGFRQRPRFLADRGGPPPSLKMIARLERGEQASYPDATIERLEGMYGYAPGAFEAILEEREPELLPEEAPPAEPPPAELPPCELPPGEPPKAPDAASAMFPGEQSLQDIWRMDEPVEVREGLVARYRELRRELLGEGSGEEGTA